MSGIELALLAGSAAASLAAGGMQAMGTIAQGQAAYDVAKAERKQLQRMASEELAVATRGADAKAREVRQVQSRVQAVAADSGGGATDDSVLNVMGDIAKEGNVQQRDILRTGQVKADDLMYRGNVGVANAKFGKTLAKRAAFGTMLGAGADAAGAFAKYGGGAPAGGAPASADYGGTPWYAQEYGYKYPRI